MREQNKRLQEGYLDHHLAGALQDILPIDDQLGHHLAGALQDILPIDDQLGHHLAGALQDTPPIEGQLVTHLTDALQDITDVVHHPIPHTGTRGDIHPIDIPPTIGIQNTTPVDVQSLLLPHVVIVQGLSLAREDAIVLDLRYLQGGGPQ